VIPGETLSREGNRIGEMAASTRPIPRQSIGMPVSIGDAYLSEALDCLLRQTFAEFELIVYDNALTERATQSAATTRGATAGSVVSGIRSTGWPM